MFCAGTSPATTARTADRALARVRTETEAIGVSLNVEKTRTVTMTDRDATFTFLGFEFRWICSRKSSIWYPCITPRPKKVTELLHKIRDVLRHGRHLSMTLATATINPIIRGWVNYFRVGNSSRAFGKVKYHVERKVRRFAAKKRQRKGFGWKRWSSKTVYEKWGLFADYRLAYAGAKARANPTET